MTNTLTLTIVTAALVASIAALCVVLVKRWEGWHYSAAISYAKVVDAEGRERDHYSFTATRDNTLIARTVGRAYIALAQARFDRLVRKHHPINAA
ncbi:hypothetical protein K7N18_25510 [Burkholderia arboris]|uniref:hypothetical protein n=1 Tax=Burkholderia arboris TaxID=488730 RepID=UPI001CA43C26|nr:hypothetical protein [Burkholderia arboris]MBY8608188.1 hypothetical protein [Burkholderia arboris]